MKFNSNQTNILLTLVFNHRLEGEINNVLKTSYFISSDNIIINLIETDDNINFVLNITRTGITGMQYIKLVDNVVYFKLSLKNIYNSESKSIILYPDVWN